MSERGARFERSGRGREGPAIVSVGVFDGLHLGHRALLDRALEWGRAERARNVVVSFDPHPDLVLDPAGFHYVAPLTPFREKRARLEALGVDELCIIPFTRELAALEPEAFVAEHLVGPHRPRGLVVGEGFALGRGRAGTVERLREIGRGHGFEVEAVPLLEIGGARVSSTRIRELLGRGAVAEAARLLGRLYSLSGKVVSGHGVGKTLGFPTANLMLHEEKLVPADGVYVARARLGDEKEWRPAATSIGVRPTFDGRVRQIEAFVLDWKGDLLGVGLEVRFVDWLRPERKFESAAALVEAMQDDVAEARRRLEAAVEPPVWG